MLMTGREAAFLIRVDAKITERQARRVLACGLAGEPLRRPGVHVFDETQVMSLMGRPTITGVELDAICPRGAFICRRDLDTLAPREEQVAAVSPGWPLSVWTRIWILSRIESQGYFPFVVTVAGFVVLGADLHDLEPRDGTTALTLGEPGAWFERLAGTRIPTGPGRPWMIRGWRPMSHHMGGWAV